LLLSYLTKLCSLLTRNAHSLLSCLRPCTRRLLTQSTKLLTETSSSLEPLLRLLTQLPGKLLLSA
tara:strand:+ start:138 stop:332 length:195 start_codon:yes stop_codon:yes gene_type:complete